ncbi:MAG: hypothetical protein IPO43_19440 [Rhodoferax sp.]|nr:hypothetical protein [Rhodoferax sp.]
MSFVRGSAGGADGIGGGGVAACAAGAGGRTRTRGVGVVTAGLSSARAAWFSGLPGSALS